MLRPPPIKEVTLAFVHEWLIDRRLSCGCYNCREHLFDIHHCNQGGRTRTANTASTNVWGEPGFSYKVASCSWQKAG
jgi:hypothetical protein